MSFEAFEVSVESGRPVELYEFSYQGGTFRYTSAETDFTYGAVFTAVPGLSRSSIEDTGDIAKNSLTITAPEDFLIARLFEVYPPSDVIDLVMYRVQRGDPLDGKTFWLGRVLNAQWTTGSSELRCESLFTRLKQPGLRRAYGRNCPHQLYGPDCRVSALTFAETAALNGIDSGGFEILSAVFDAQPDGYFAGGKVEWDAGGGVTERRGIRLHVGDSITLTHPIIGLTAGDTVIAYPGCDKTDATCVSKFSNLPNYGGWPFIPIKNPFSQTVY